MPSLSLSLSRARKYIGNLFRSRLGSRSPLSKIIFSTLITIALATTLVSASGEVMTAGWFNDLNTKLANIFSSGSNIGIGQSNPTEKLDVNGNGSFSGIVSANTPIAPSNLTTKAYVDAAIVSGAGGNCTYIGSSCGGGIKVGKFNGATLIVTPGGCNNSPSPTCPGTTDTLKKAWSTEQIYRSVTSPIDGSGNTTTFMNIVGGVNYPAAKYCADMDYGGYQDWYLPSNGELQSLYLGQSAIGGFDMYNYYWSSTETNSTNAYPIVFIGGLETNSPITYDKASIFLVRCIRKI